MKRRQIVSSSWSSHGSDRRPVEPHKLYNTTLFIYAAYPTVHLCCALLFVTSCTVEKWEIPAGEHFLNSRLRLVDILLAIFFTPTHRITWSFGWVFFSSRFSSQLDAGWISTLPSLTLRRELLENSTLTSCRLKLCVSVCVCQPRGRIHGARLLSWENEEQASRLRWYKAICP